MVKVVLKTLLPSKANKENFEVSYGFGKTQFGICLIALHNEQICYLGFSDEGKEDHVTKRLKEDWPNASLTLNTTKVAPFIKGIFEDDGKKLESVVVLLRGTDFQVSVWKELMKVKPGTMTSYSQMASEIGKPKAIRAVASAIARNKVAYLIPCHRVIRKSGALHKYGWGAERKVEMLKYEAELYGVIV